jgi:hypothetical protein
VKLCACYCVDNCTLDAEEKIMLRGVKYALMDARGVGEEKQRWMLGTGSLYFFTELWVAFSRSRHTFVYNCPRVA